MSAILRSNRSANVGAGLGLYELRHDAEVVFGVLDATFEYVARPELASELGDVHGLAFVLKGGVAREHPKIARCPRQFGHQVLGQAVAEILLLRVTA